MNTVTHRVESSHGSWKLRIDGHQGLICGWNLPAWSHFSTLNPGQSAKIVFERSADPLIERWARSVEAFFEGDGGSAKIDVKLLDWSSFSAFRTQVMKALATLKRGETLTYQELAQKAGRPKASRGVGRVMATNPFPLLYPCHRVLRADRKPSGFSAPGGWKAKELLLSLEGVELSL